MEQPCSRWLVESLGVVESMLEQQYASWRMCPFFPLSFQAPVATPAITVSPASASYLSIDFATLPPPNLTVSPFPALPPASSTTVRICQVRMAKG